MRVKTKRLSTIIVASLLVLAAVSAVHAEDSSDVKDGWYLGLQAVDNSMSGDFDNSTYYLDPPELFDVPEVDDGTGFGFLLGVKRDKIALELGYQRSSHDTTSSFIDMGSGGNSEASFNVIDLNFRYDIFAQNRFRPYVLLGVGFPWLTIEDSMLDGTSYEDETFTGIGFNLGAGVAYYLHPQWALTGGLIYRWNRFGSVEGNKIEKLSEKTLGLSLGLTYTF